MDEYAGIAVWAAVVGFELWAAKRKPHLTLSRTVARVFRTDDTAGRIMFTFAWAAIAIWFCKHIIRDVGK